MDPGASPMKRGDLIQDIHRKTIYLILNEYDDPDIGINTYLLLDSLGNTKEISSWNIRRECMVISETR
jgi:hypothetical protein